MNDQLIKDLIQDEGFRGHPYTCTAGKQTIGYGRNIEDKGISEDEARILLMNDIAQCETEARQVFPEFLSLNRVRQNVITNMIFNMGIRTFETFRNTIAAIKAEDYETAAREMLDSAWATQVGTRAIRLTEEMRTGAYASG